MEKLEKLSIFGRNFYSFKELERILGIEKRRDKYIIVNRLVKRGVLISFTKGYYSTFKNQASILELANQVYAPSYLSFTTVLGKTGVLNQKSFLQSFATPLRSKKTIIGDVEIHYHHLKSQLYFGFEYDEVERIHLAYPEKALLDQLYLVSLGIDHLDWAELNLGGLNKQRFKKYLSLFPKKTKRLVEEKILHFSYDKKSL